MAEVSLPQLGETVTEGTITRWFKQVGDTVVADEPLFEVSTDKVDTEVPSPVGGVLQEVRVPEGETVAVGTVVAVVGDGPADAGAAPADEPAQEPEEETAKAADTEPAPKQEATEQDEPAQEQAEAAEPPAADVAPEPAPEQPAAPETSSDDDRSSAGGGDGLLLSPVVRRLVNEHGLDPASITGSGPGGRITRDDVLDLIDQRAAAPSKPAATAASSKPAAASAPAAQADAAESDTGSQQPAAETPAAAAPGKSAAAPAPTVAAGQGDSTVALSKIRKLTGSHMIMSKSVSPHAFSVVEVDFANVDVTRAAVKHEWKQAEGFSLTYLPFITRAIVEALTAFPHLNASVGDNELVVHNYIDIGVAVDMNYEGLLVPVIRAAETKRLRAIAREINDLAGRARTKKLSPDEITGGTFTISNNGSAGSVLTMPIINQPQVAILSTDAIVRKPVVVDAGGAEAIAIHPVGNLAMSWDHRAFDGAYAAGFLVKVKDELEQRDWSAEL